MATEQSSTTIGTGITNPALTEQKCLVLEKQGKKDLADLARSLFGLQKGLGGAAKTIDEKLKSMDRYSKNAIQTLFSVEITAAKSINKTSTSIAGGLNNATSTITTEIGNLKTNLNKALQPVSSATGQTLATLTNVLKDPLGAPFTIGQSLVSVVDKINPGFTNSLDATFKKFKADDLMNLPSQMMGSLRNLASLVDSILTLPLAIAEDLYQGLQEIMQEMADLLDSVMGAIFDLIFGPKGVLDSILPMTEIISFLDSVSQVMSIAGSVTGSFTGITQVNQYLSMGQSYLSQANSFLSNPMALAQSYLPPEASQFTSYMRDPDQLIGQLLPADIKDQLGQIANIPGLGFVGNLGYGVESTLSTLKDGFATQILNELESQTGILSPLLGKTSSQSSLTNAQQAYPPTVEGSSINPNIPVNNQGVPVSVTDPPSILMNKNENQPGINNPNSQQFLVA